MPRANYEPKGFLKDMIHDVALTETQDGGASMVVAAGLYGERGIAFYPFEGDNDPDAKVGFSLLGRGVNTSHTNLSRADAADIVGLLVNAYGFNVSVETVTTTTVNVS